MIKKENTEKQKEKIEKKVINNKSEHNQDIIPSFKEINYKINNKKIIFKKDSITSTDNESDLSQKNIFENFNNINLSNLKNILEIKTLFPQNSAFKRMISTSSPISTTSFFNPFNYFLNFQNSNTNVFSPIYFNNNQNNNCILKSSNKNKMLNKKRKAKKSIILTTTKVSIKTILNFNEKKKLFEVSKKNDFIKPIKKYFKIREKKNEKIYCNHLGCDIIFKTKKQKLFHHFKMSPECQEDTISLLKMILEIKKILLKDIKKNENIFEKYSKLYENAMKDISLTDYINIITGTNIMDKTN